MISALKSFRLRPLSKRTQTILKYSAVTGCVLTYMGGMTVFGALAIASKGLPDPQSLWGNQRPVSVKIVDRLKRDVLVRGATVAPRVDLDNLPFHIPLTILAVEDKRFKSHIGIDPEALTRAMVQNLKAGAYVQGGSTLTQQLSKNVFLSPEKTLRRKVQEMFMAIWLERNFTKDEILELYLSKVYFGNGAWGIEAASERYFNKPAAELNLPEISMLAGLLKAPSALNPVNNPKAASDRTAVVLNVLLQQNIIDRAMYDLSLAYPIRIHRPQSDNSAQYFVNWIWPEIEVALGGAPTQDIVVRTTLDLSAQKQAALSVTQNLDMGRGAEQAALVTLDGTGAVLAMIGGRSYSDSQFNRAVQAKRQPGSAFKPFVYLTALEAGVKPWDKRIDAPITLESRIDSWTPRNFKNEFLGPITLETAFLKSINTVAVSLGEELGRDAVIATANRFGFEGLQPVRSLALGSQVTTPLKLTQAYLPFSNFGHMAEPYGIVSITTSNGTPLYDATDPARHTIINTNKLAEMNRMMMRVVDSGTGRRAHIAGFDVAGKTGTTNDFRDAWFVGYAPDIVTGVWVGNDSNNPMKHVTGGNIPAKIFHDFMAPQLETMPKAKLLVAAEPLWASKDQSFDALLNNIKETLPD